MQFLKLLFTPLCYGYFKAIIYINLVHMSTIMYVWTFIHVDQRSS